MNNVIPVFRIFDVAKAKEFYIDWLGFRIDWEHQFDKNAPLYMSVSKDDITLHLSEHYGDAAPGSKIMINCKNLKEYFETLRTKNYRYYKPGVEDSVWHSYIMALTDPFGNRIVFNEPKDT